MFNSVYSAFTCNPACRRQKQTDREVLLLIAYWEKVNLLGQHIKPAVNVNIFLSK